MSIKHFINFKLEDIQDSDFVNHTDLIDWAIMDYIASITDDKSFHDLFYSDLINAMPLLNLNSKSAISKRVIKLKELGLVITQKYSDSSLGIKLTPEGSKLTLHYEKNKHFPRRTNRNHTGSCPYMNLNPKCQVFLSIGAQIDHIIPKSRGGSESVTNKQVICPVCNSMKSSMTHNEFIEYLSSCQ